MGSVVPMRREISIQQCRSTGPVEELMVSYTRRTFAMWRDWNRFWWGA